MRYRLTKSLLDAWYYSFRLDEGYETFLDVLNRIPIQPNDRMLRGTEFESCVNSALDGNPVPENHKWYHGIMTMAEYLEGSQQQVNLHREITVDGVDFLIHGVLDYLRAGVIYDCKFTSNYHLNKYLNSSQHPFYLYLVPEARRFEYVISNGTDVFWEKYPRYIVQEPDGIIRDFMRFLDKQNLTDIYFKNWEVSYYGKLVELPA
jgi:hypothetical protein